MQQFIPFEDDWDALEQLRPEALIPYRVGLVPVHEPVASQAAGTSLSDSRGPDHSVATAAVSRERSA
jgi:hypothetical protein